MPLVTAAGYPVLQAPNVQSQPGIPNNYQNVRATPDAFGAAQGEAFTGLSRSLNQAGEHFERAALERQNLFNQVAAHEASNYAIEESNKLLDGLASTHGKDALEAAPKVTASISKLYSDARTKLTNPYQQITFDGETRRLFSLQLSEIRRHADREFDRYQEQTNKSGYATALQGATNNAEDPAVFNTYVEGMMKSAIREAQRVGGGQEVIDAAIGKVRSDAVTAKVEALTPHKPQEALKFLEENKDALSGQHYATLYNQVHSKAISQTAKDLSFKYAGPSSQAKVTPEEVTATAQKIGVDPTLANAVAAIESGHGANLGTRGNIYQMGVAEKASVGGSSESAEGQLEQGVKFLKNKQAELTTSLGRPPTNAEIYLAHQQGSAGATALINNPDKPAGQVVPAVNISSNGGDPNAPASQFVNMWAQKYNQYASHFGGGKVIQTVGPTTDQQIPGLTQAIEQIHKDISDPELRAATIQATTNLYHARWADQNNAYTEYQRQRTLQERSLNDDYIKKLFPKGDAAPAVTAVDIANDPKLEGFPDLKKQLIAVAERESKPEALGRVSSANSQEIFRRMHLPEDDPQRISDPKDLNSYFSNGQINKTDLDWLRKEFDSFRTPVGTAESALKQNLLKTVENKLTGKNLGNGFQDPKGGELMQTFLARALPEIDRLKAAGKTAQQIYNPESPDYIGKLADSLVRPSSEWIKDLIQGSAIPAQAIEDLKKSPGTAAQFDQIFGVGAAAKILGTTPSISPPVR